MADADKAERAPRKPRAARSGALPDTPAMRLRRTPGPQEPFATLATLSKDASPDPA